MTAQRQIEDSLVGLKPIQEIIHIATLTPFIDKAIPISIMLIAPSGGGKTQTLRRFNADFIHHTNDLTSSGLWAILKDDKEQKVKHICLEDFNPLLSHKSSVSSLTIASLLSVMCDGMLRIDDGRVTKELTHSPVGVITGVTPEMFRNHLEKWHELGFIRRFLPIHFNYTTATISAAQKHVRHGKANSKPATPIHVKKPSRLVSPIVEEKVGIQIEMLSTYLGGFLGVNAIVRKDDNNRWQRQFTNGKSVLPMAPHIILRTMAQARALRDGRMKVDESDVDFLKRLVDFANPMNPVQL